MERIKNREKKSFAIYERQQMGNEEETFKPYFLYKAPAVLVKRL